MLQCIHEMRQKLITIFETYPLKPLAYLWAGGLLILVILIFFFDNGTSNKELYQSKFSLLQDTSSNARANPSSANDAYVFISVNKKHFLTRFVAVEPHQVNDVTLPANPAVKKINKIIKPQNRSRSRDLYIKPVPE